MRLTVNGREWTGLEACTGAGSRFPLSHQFVEALSGSNSYQTNLHLKKVHFTRDARPLGTLTDCWASAPATHFDLVAISLHALLVQVRQYLSLSNGVLMFDYQADQIGGPAEGAGAGHDF